MDGTKNRMVEAIGSPEFINVQSVSPQLSKCSIKVLYVGKNRNGSEISKDVAIKMAGTLRGVPIIGHYVESKQSFGDHGEQMTIDGEGVHFDKLTKPYGFVPLDSKIWFQTYKDFDDAGNEVEHEYLMCEGLLWTTLYEECKVALQHLNQSMELNGDSMKGYWSDDTQSGLEFFIITDATFNALCMLGEDVEPCFETAGISQHYSLADKDFFTTMYQIKNAIYEQYLQKGGTNKVENQNLQNDYENLQKNYNELNDKYTALNDSYQKMETEYNQYKTDMEQKMADYEKTIAANNEEYNQKSETMTKQIEELEAYKKDNENKKKDELIEQFNMLSEEDKADVIANKENYSLEDIESKLSVICFRKKINFTEPEQPVVTKNETEVSTSFNLKSDSEAEVPELVKLLNANRQNI